MVIWKKRGKNDYHHSEELLHHTVTVKFRKPEPRRDWRLTGYVNAPKESIWLYSGYVITGEEEDEYNGDIESFVEFFSHLADYLLLVMKKDVINREVEQISDAIINLEAEEIIDRKVI